MDGYLTPLATVPSWEFDEYKEVLEETVEQRMDDIPERDLSYDFDSYGNHDVHAVERRMYGELLDELDDIESKTELMRYTQEQVKSPESALPTPFDLFMRPFDRLIEGERANVLEDVFEEAKQELNT